MNDGRRKKPQKHQNKTAFKIQFDTLALDIHKKVSLSLLCKRCVQQINWKLQFNKYKKITEPGKCNFCHQKNVVRSYMKSCDPCAQKEDVCPKCLGKDLETPQGDQVKLSEKQQTQKDKQQERALNEYIDSLKQRSRRKVRRQYEKGVITWDNQNKLFRDLEGAELIGLKFKNKGLQDLEKEMDEDFDMDQNLEQQSEGDDIQENTTKKQKKAEARQIQSQDFSQDHESEQIHKQKGQQKIGKNKSENSGSDCSKKGSEQQGEAEEDGEDGDFEEDEQNGSDEGEGKL